MGLEKLDAGALVAKVGFKADKDDGCCWAEMEDFGIPLWTTLVILINRHGC